MQKENIAAIALVIIIVVALSAFILTSEDVLENLFGKKIGSGDCVDLHYIGRYASNNSVFDTSYESYENKSGGTPLQMFINLNETVLPSEDYVDYITGIEGFIEGLIDLNEGESATIGPIPPEKAYGVKPTLGNIIPFTDPQTGKEIRIVVVSITENAPMPADFVSLFGDINTTLYNLKFEIYSKGEQLTMYPVWENATVVSNINDTTLWYYTTPPDDKMENFTWIDQINGTELWENASSVTTLNETTIIVTHTPEIGSTMQDLYFEYTVEDLTDDTIKASYVDYDGNTSYSEFERKVTIQRNESQPITVEYPTEGFEGFLDVLKFYYNLGTELSFHDLADESLIFEVTILEVHKNCQAES
jgi:FKBP-type peptidyl-prolyl cis-trans isomerase 2